MLRRRFDSFLGNILLAVILPLVLFSAIRARIGFARTRKKAQRADSPRQPAPRVRRAAREFQFGRPVEAYEHTIDSAVSEERV